MTLDLRLVPAALLAWLACALAVGLPAGVAAAAAGGLGVVAAAVGLRRGPAAVWLALAVAALACASCAAQLHERTAGPLTALAADGAAARLEGVVRGEPSCAGPGCRPVVVVAAERVVGRGVPGAAAARVLLVGDVAHLAYGARVEAVGVLAPAEPGDDVQAVLRVLEVQVRSPPAGVDAAVGRLRSGLLAATEHLAPDLRGLVPGAAIGDTTRVPADLDRAMRDSGLTHITAVSGSHFAVLSTAVAGLAALLRLPRVVRAVVAAGTTAGFVALVHPQPSVVRAAVMGLVGVAGLLAGRPARTVPALATAVVLLVLVDPWLARSYGFVLSVVATAAIALLAPVVAARLEAVLPRWLAMAVAVPLAAQAACAPVIVLIDPAVSLVAVPANLAAAPALLPATVLGVAGTLLVPVLPGLAHVLLQGAAAACWWIAQVARATAGLPGARQPWLEGAAGAAALAAATAVVLGVALCVPPRRWRSLAAPLGCVVVVAVLAVPLVRWATAPAWVPQDWDVAMCDVGQGDMLVVRSGPEAAVVVDAGPDPAAADACLRDLGVARVDLLVLTHFHADHVDGVPGVLHGRGVAAALVSPLAEPAGAARATRSALEAAGVPVTVADPTARGTAGEVAWRVLGPTGRASEPNDASVVVHLVRPQVGVLALGDTGEAAQDALVARLAGDPQARGAAVVKMAHHGSADQSPRLAALLSPTVVLVGVGRDNDYGHPTAHALGLYRARGATVLPTSTCGPIALAAVADGLRVVARCVGG